MTASTTRPTPPRKLRPARSLRTRWRSYMILGMTLLVIVITGSASLIMLLEGRQAILRLHETAARQVQVGIGQAVDDAQRAMARGAQAIPADNVAGADLEGLLSAYPALRAVSVVGSDGVEIAHAPADSTRTAPDWTQNPAWIAVTLGETAGKPAHALVAGESPALDVAVPLTGAPGVLIAEFDPQRLWQAVLAAPVGEKGYAYLASSDGALLATGPDVRPDRTRDPARFAVFEDARGGHAATRVYRGLSGGWVVGRAVPVPGEGDTLLTETPLAEFATPIVRGLALWLLALALALAVGEWLVRRILRTVLAPLEALRQGARAVTAGDYGYRVRIPHNADRELFELGGTFNTMVERLALSQKQIDAYTNQMRETVDLRARELSRKALQLEVAAEVSGKIATNLDPRTLNAQVADLIKARFDVYWVEILRVEEDGRIVPTSGRPNPPTPVLSVHDSAHSVTAWVAQNGETLYVPDVKVEPRYRPSPDLPASQCELAVPLKYANRVIGVLNLEAEHRDAFPEDEIAVLEALANQIAVSMHNADTFKALENANRDLAQATLQANQANTLKSRFLLNASHKLRTPLNAVIGYSEAILSGVYGEMPEKILDRERRILENGRVLQALVEDMLDLSAIETGQMQLNLQWVELRPLLAEVMNAARALYQTTYTGHTLTLQLDLDHLAEPLPPVWADLDRLRYILINLMSNAVKFTPSGEVVMSADFDDETVRIHVRDTGPGISEDELRYLFQPFQHQRGSTASGGKGTGLGLPVSRLLAMRHGGDLTVESVLHQGSTFTLNLPRLPDGAPPPPAASAGS
jgi:signal transduction histidine kinase